MNPDGVPIGIAIGAPNGVPMGIPNGILMGPDWNSIRITAGFPLRSPFPYGSPWGPLGIAMPTPWGSCV